mmetsp:Transcript_35735/g.70820  ORF Transcript_35735/g.70820 Transcript_35735/m.70820 type:complete len:350 (-) Transcript_35735:107-1156(-)
MSTLALFERHRKLGQEHEERAHMWLEDARAGLQKEGALAGGMAAATFEEAGELSRSVAKIMRLAMAQQRLALHEYKEARRLRPRDVDTKQRLSQCLAVLKRLHGAVTGPRARPLRRFVAHYNLSIRYWDLGKAKEALEEAEKACTELRKANLPCGCAEHNLVLMAQVQAEHAAEQRRLQEAIARSPESLGANYDLGVLFFDKRMLLRAEAQLKWTQECAKAISARHLVEQSYDRRPADPELAIKRATRMANMLGELGDDLEFIGGLRELWCVEEEAGKADELQATGIRDGARPRLLPCLRRRFSAESEPCDVFCSELCGRPDVDLTAQAEKHQYSNLRPSSRRRRNVGC